MKEEKDCSDIVGVVSGLGGGGGNEGENVPAGHVVKVTVTHTGISERVQYRAQTK